MADADASELGHGIDRVALARGARALATEYRTRSDNASSMDVAARCRALSDDYTVFAAHLEGFDAYGAAILPSSQAAAENTTDSRIVAHHG